MLERAGMRNKFPYSNFISELKSKAAQLREIADKLESAGDALAELGGSTADNVSARSLAVPGLGDLSGLSGVDAIYRVLSEADSPVWKRHLLDILRDRGKPIGENTLQSYLSRDNRFRTYGAGRWGLVAPPEGRIRKGAE